MSEANQRTDGKGPRPVVPLFRVRPACNKRGSTAAVQTEAQRRTRARDTCAVWRSVHVSLPRCVCAASPRVPRAPRTEDNTTRTEGDKRADTVVRTHHKGHAYQLTHAHAPLLRCLPACSPLRVQLAAPGAALAGRRPGPPTESRTGNATGNQWAQDSHYFCAALDTIHCVSAAVWSCCDWSATSLTTERRPVLSFPVVFGSLRVERRRTAQTGSGIRTAYERQMERAGALTGCSNLRAAAWLTVERCSSRGFTQPRVEATRRKGKSAQGAQGEWEQDGAGLAYLFAQPHSTREAPRVHSTPRPRFVAQLAYPCSCALHSFAIVHSTAGFE
jgi:hypothetical protein